MDRYSHIALAKGLLQVANEREDLAYMSILPLVDGEPSFLHRLHCHPLSKAPVVVESAKYVFGTTNDTAPNVSNDSFEVRRIQQEKSQFINAFNDTIGGGEEKMRVDDSYGALLSVLSHSYFDTYNNAVQAFAPYESYCAGQYDMWHEIDYFNYRIKWYQKTAPDVRKKVLNEGFWNLYSFESKELVKGMIHRVAEFTKPRVSRETIEQVERDLNVHNVDENPMVIEFYKSLEKSLRDHLVESVSNTEKVSVKL